MSGGFSLFGEMANGQNVGLSTTTGGTLVNGGTGASNTKGSWVQLVASLSFDATWALVKLYSDSVVSANVNNILVDIGLGAAASEVIIASNLHYCGYAGDGLNAYLFPVCIPAGTRIAARAQADFTSLNGCYVTIELFDSGFAAPIEGAGLDDMGPNLSTSNLTLLTMGLSGAKGSYVQLTASSTRDYAGLLFAYNTAAPNAVACFDIAVGAAASEQIIIPDNFIYMKAGTPCGCTFFPFFIPIPAGTRISVRGSVASAGPSPSASAAGVYGIYQ